MSLSDIKKKLKGYRYADQTARDAHALIENFRNLKVRDIKPFVHGNGSKENCVSVSGTIPVQIRGTNYNIPVSIWLRPTHPYNCPMVYVTPTEDMGIQQSRYVDASGLVYLPYLSEWKQNSSDLPTLTQILCATFAEHCPVYSKRNVPQQQQPTPQSGGWGQPNRPVQPPSTYATPSNFPTPQPYGNTPPRGPYPGQHSQSSYPPQQTPYPSGGQTGMPTPYNPPGGYPYHQGAASQQTPYPPQGQYGSVPYSQSHQPGHTGSTSSIQSPPATAVGSSFVTAVPHRTPSAEEERKQMEEHERIKRQSLESAVEDKIRRQVKQVLDAAQVEMDGMMATQEKLKKGSEEINKMMDDMGQKRREVDESIDLLRNKKAELMSLLDYLRAQPETVDVDDAVMATNPLYNQILRLYAEENAIDDTIYYLGEALRKGVIDLDAFLKHVRELSRQQFKDRATIMKARTTAGLAQHGVPS
ncbi:tumor susceptibility gene 101 protein-like [Halichondria panicea]|uniref:tumor susceptibility gene 101 protein-like n=1 Tax=Halichondria panicea TaxID=6063 RepID=UPI00312B6D87